MTISRIMILRTMMLRASQKKKTHLSNLKLIWEKTKKVMMVIKYIVTSFYLGIPRARLYAYGLSL